MSGTPTTAEIQAQWRASVDILETARTHIDDTMAGGGGKFDVLNQLLEGEFTPDQLAVAVRDYRLGYSSLISPQRARQFIEPCVFEYGGILRASAALGFGSGYDNIGPLWSALYEWFIDNALTVESRAIVYDITPTATGTGNGEMSRLTVDHNALDLEACTVEKKMFRCRQDQNLGVLENAEIFEVNGEQPSQDSVGRPAFGSGVQSLVRSHHAGTGAGGSLLSNSSFTTFDAAASPKFSGWDEAAGGDQLAQSSTFYRTHQGAASDKSLEMTGGGGTVTLKQTLANMRVSSLNTDTPYFLRVMVNKSTALGGSVTLRLGSQTKTVTVASLSAGWNELLIDIGIANWPRIFNEAAFDVEIEWSASTSGTLLFDDMLFAEWDVIDGTFWFLRGNDPAPVAWLVDDLLVFTDTGGAPGTAKIQYWSYVGQFGYLPHTTGVPTFTEP